MSQLRAYLPDRINNYAMYYIGRARCTLQGYYDNTFSATELSDRIYVGDIASASNKLAMQEQGITHILSIYNGAYEIFSTDFTYKLIHINDDPWVKIENYFDESNDFIDIAMSDPNNKIMIHCQQGISRSITLLLAYKLKKMNETKQIKIEDINESINNVLDNVKMQRNIADPNGGFIEALRIYICKLNDYKYDDIRIIENENVANNTNNTNDMDNESKNQETADVGYVASFKSYITNLYSNTVISDYADIDIDINTTNDVINNSTLITCNKCNMEYAQ